MGPGGGAESLASLPSFCSLTWLHFFFSSPPANHIAATGIHQNLEVYLYMYPQGPIISSKLYSCAAWKIQHSRTCAVIESIEIFIAQEGCNGTGRFCGGGGVRKPSTLVKSRQENHIPFSSASCSCLISLDVFAPFLNDEFLHILLKYRSITLKEMMNQYSKATSLSYQSIR